MNPLKKKLALLAKMIKEEWRMHSSLFGGYKFGLFPIAIFFVSLLMFLMVPLLTLNQTEIQFLTHFLVLFFGMSLGSIGFISRSGMNNVLGKTNLLLFSSRTLPLSRVKIMFNFVVKDMIYYFLLFIIPFTVGGLTAGYLPFDLPFTIYQISPLSLISLSFAFLMGISLTFFFSVIYTKSKALFALILVSITFLASYVGLFQFGWLLNPALQFYYNPNLTSLLQMVGLPSILIVTSLIFFERKKNKKITKTKSKLRQYASNLGPLQSKNFLDIERSNGGFGKLVFSFAVLFLVFWFLIEQFNSMFLDSRLLSFSVFLSLTAITSYSWLNRFDSFDKYSALPLDKSDILKGKVTSYFYLGLPGLIVANFLGFYLFGSDLIEVPLALLISVSSSLYLVLIIARLTGLEPNSRLFDVLVFVKFSAFSCLFLIPLLVFTFIFNRCAFLSGVAIISLTSVESLIAYYFIGEL